MSAAVSRDVSAHARVDAALASLHAQTIDSRPVPEEFHLADLGRRRRAMNLSARTIAAAWGQPPHAIVPLQEDVDVDVDGVPSPASTRGPAATVVVLVVPEP